MVKRINIDSNVDIGKKRILLVNSVKIRLVFFHHRYFLVSLSKTSHEHVSSGFPTKKELSQKNKKVKIKHKTINENCYVFDAKVLFLPL